jgi:hypothetical protein
MLLDHAMESLPLWLLGIILFVLLALVCRAGMWLRARRKDDGRSDDEGYLLSAALALLGLLIAFTFSLALNRYDARRDLVLKEANAIGTAWLRAGLVEGTAGRDLQASLAGYTDIRLRLPLSGGNADAALLERASASAQSKLWKQMTAATRDVPPPIAATIVTAFNDLFDIASARKAERAARIPSRVLEVLVLYALMAAAIIGYVLGGTGKSHRTVTSILFVLLTLALLLILDLDRPWSGSITVSQQPMIDARAGMR